MKVVMPQLGETVAEGTLTVWHKKSGERVEANELLFEVSTDKVDTEIPAPASGTLVEVLVEEGVTVDVGATLGIIQLDGEEAVTEPADHLLEINQGRWRAAKQTVFSQIRFSTCWRVLERLARGEFWRVFETQQGLVRVETEAILEFRRDGIQHAEVCAGGKELVALTA